MLSFGIFIAKYMEANSLFLYKSKESSPRVFALLKDNPAKLAKSETKSVPQYFIIPLL